MDTKYGKYVITEQKTTLHGPWEPQFQDDELKKMLCLDDEVLKGAFYVDSAWFFPGLARRDESQDNIKPHSHDYDEVQAVFGTNLEDPNDLGGEMEFWLGDEKQVITKSCLIFIPKGLKHGPIYWRRLEKPVFHFVCGTTGKAY